MVKLRAFDSSYFCGKSHFEDNGIQNVLVFQPVSRYFKKLIIITNLQHGNEKDCLMTVLNLLHKRLIIVSLEK